MKAPNYKKIQELPFDFWIGLKPGEEKELGNGFYIYKYDIIDDWGYKDEDEDEEEDVSPIVVKHHDDEDFLLTILLDYENKSIIIEL